MLTAIRLLCAAALLCSAIGSSFIVTGSARARAQTAPARNAPESPNRRGEIVMDGRFDDWTAVEPAMTDPFDAPHSFVDFGAISIADDPRFVHLLIDFGGEVSVQRLPGRAILLLDVDGSTRTGMTAHEMPGVDLAVELSPANPRQPDRPGMGIGVQSATYQPPPDDPDRPPLSPYDLGLTFAPTHSSRVIEFRLERGVTLPETPTTFAGTEFSGKLVFLNAAGRLGDETQVFQHRFTSRPGEAPAARTMTDDPLSPPAKTFRVVSWNARDGSMFANPDPFSRVLRALDPDVMLWQELSDRNTALQLKAFLDRALPESDRGDWQVVFSRGGGNLRTAIASRRPLIPVEALDMLPYPDRLDRQVRVSGAIVEIDGRRILLASVHLKCCGGLDSREDNQRRAETRLINKAIRQVLAQERLDGLIVGGDLNLVGAPEPLALLAEALDRNDRDLRTLDLRQLDGRSNATWSDRAQPFVPGRLDYLLHSGTTLQARGGFVLESADLPPRWLEARDLQASDTAIASDHWPLVADFAFFDAVGD